MFFAGAGSGLSFVVFFLDSFVRCFRPHLYASYRPLVAPGHLVGIVCVICGAVFLVFDLGRVDRLLELLVDPSVTVLATGAWFLALFLALTALQMLLRLRFAERVPKVVHIAVRWASALSALAVMLYVGLLLQDLRSVHFWNSPLLPAILVLSSLSGGVALLMLISFFRQADGVPLRLMAQLSGTHLPLIVCESLLLAAYVALALHGSPAAAESAAELVSGDYLLPFWGGVVACGIAVPLGVEWLTHRKATWSLTAVYALMLLAGTLAIRYCFLMVGTHPDVQLASSLAL
jgi:formate-dependent nitrite reductase membrane component NrfD